GHQARLHGGRRDGEGLEDQAPQQHGDKQRRRDGSGGVDDLASELTGLGDLAGGIGRRKRGFGHEPRGTDGPGARQEHLCPDMPRSRPDSASASPAKPASRRRSPIVAFAVRRRVCWTRAEKRYRGAWSNAESIALRNAATAGLSWPATSPRRRTFSASVAAFG